MLPPISQDGRRNPDSLSAHRGARADGFAACTAKYGTARLLRKLMFRIKNFPGCGAVLLPGCSILIFLEGRMIRHVSCVT